MKIARLALLSAAGLAAWPSGSALACSYALCRSPSVFPSTGTLPANLQRLRFSSRFSMLDGDGGTSTPRLYRLEGTSKVSVPFDSEPIDANNFWIEPIDAQAAGTTLVLEFDRSQGCAPGSAQYTVTEAKPLPTSLGTLTSSSKNGAIQIASGGSCTETVSTAYTDFKVQLSAEAAPYASLFNYTTYIDGELSYPFSSNASTGEGLPQGEDRTFTICEAGHSKLWGNELTAGVHRIRFEATLPDGTKLSTAEISFEQACTGGPIDLRDAGPKNDAGTKPDAGITGGVDSGLPANPRDDDDGCSLASSRSSCSGLLLAIALLLRRRNKQR